MPETTNTTQNAVNEIEMAPECEGQWNVQDAKAKTTISRIGKAGDDDHGIIISYPDGDTKKVAWKNMQLWDVGTMNPVGIYNGERQYTVAWSSGPFVGDGIRCFGKSTRTAFMVNVPKPLFLYVAKCRGMEDKIASWEAKATEYTPQGEVEGEIDF